VRSFEKTITIQPGIAMKIEMELTKDSKAEFKRILKEFEAATGIGVDQGIRQIGLSTARELAHQFQPYGLKSDKGEKFIKSIGAQVDRAYLGVNLGAFPATSDMKDAHFGARKQGGRQAGQVPNRQFRKEQGKPWLGLITQAQKEIYKRKVQAKAGRAKAAWIEAGNQLTKAKISGVAKWINRHLPSAFGKAVITGSGLKTQVELINLTPYADKKQTSSQIKAAIKSGQKKGVKRLQILTAAAIKKAMKGNP
jgi:hypothetical protein